MEKPGKLDGAWLRRVAAAVALAAAAVALVLYIEPVWSFLTFIYRILRPLLIGLGLAYVLNLPMRFFERALFGRARGFLKKLGRPVSIALSYLLVAVLLALVGLMVVPQLIDSGKSLVASFPGYMDSLFRWAENLITRYNLDPTLLDDLTAKWQQYLQSALEWAESMVPEFFTFTKGLTAGVVNTIVGLIMSLYMLAAKERLISQLQRLIKAFLPVHAAREVIRVGRMANEVFSRFIAGQLLEALVIGALCFIGMAIFRMPYALLISVVIGLTNLVPIAGPLLGTIPCAFIIFTIDPVTALWFVVFIVVLQQLESNLIYPRVVGDTIGLSGLWVLLAVILGGGLFGLGGVLMGVPTMAVVYRLLSEKVKQRNDRKQLEKALAP